MKLPKIATLHPISTEHPANCAYWITCSPHEWTWTQEQQEAMARTIVNARLACGEVAELLTQISKHSCRSCHIERMAREAMDTLGFDIPRPPTEPLASSSVEETSDAFDHDVNDDKCQQCGNDLYWGCTNCHNEQIEDLKRIERHRNALLRFIETIPHSDYCAMVLTEGCEGEAPCNCHHSRIPKP